MNIVFSLGHIIHKKIPKFRSIGRTFQLLNARLSTLYCCQSNWSLFRFLFTIGCMRLFACCVKCIFYERNTHFFFLISPIRIWERSISICGTWHTTTIEYWSDDHVLYCYKHLKSYCLHKHYYNWLESIKISPKRKYLQSNNNNDDKTDARNFFSCAMTFSCSASKSNEWSRPTARSNESYSWGKHYGGYHACVKSQYLQMKCGEEIHMRHKC